MTNADLLIAACALVAVAFVAATTLVGWQNWLALKNRELEMAHTPAPRQPHEPREMYESREPHESRGPNEGVRFAREGAARIELADLKERVRRLEAIANGVDL